MTTEMRSGRDVIIRTSAWAEAVGFYEKVLGFQVKDRGKTIVGFETGSFMLFVERGKDHGPVFDFLVADIQATKKRLLAEGCTLIEEDASVPRVYVRDPYGVVFNIGQRPEESSR
jgi:predicted enzyme related to lactoylglutathione lyase